MVRESDRPPEKVIAISPPLPSVRVGPSATPAQRGARAVSFDEIDRWDDVALDAGVAYRTVYQLAGACLSPARQARRSSCASCPG